MGVSLNMKICTLAVLLIAALAGCDRPRDQMWSAKAVRIRPGKTLKVKVIKKEKGPEAATAGKKDKDAAEALKPKLLELLKEMKSAREAQDEEAEKKAIDAIQALERAKVITPIRDITLSNPEGLGEQALRVIGTFKDPELLGMLTKPLKGTDVYLAGAAAWAIGEIGKATVNNQLVEVLGNAARPTSVRVEAALALGKIGNKGAVEPLLEALGGDNEELSVAAAVALGKLKDLRALDPLRAKLGVAKGNDAELELELATTLMLYFNDIDAPRVVASRLIGGTQDVRKKALAVMQKHENRREVGRLVVDLLAENPGNAFDIIEAMRSLCTGEEDCLILLKQKKREVKGGPAVNACDQAIGDLKAAAAARAPKEPEGEEAEAGGKKKKKKKKKKRRRKKKRK